MSIVVTKERTKSFDAPLPHGWANATINDLITSNGIFCDGDWVESKDQDPNGEVRLIQLADIGDGDYKNKSSRYLTIDKAKELKCTFLQSSDVLVARMPDPLGRACIFPGNSQHSVTVVDVCIIRPGERSINVRWLMYIINSPNVRSAFASLQSGSTRQRISRSNLASVEFPVPPLPEQQRIVEALEQQLSRLDAGVAALRSAQKKLKRYRASVLKAAVEGKLTQEWRKSHPEVEPAPELLKRILQERRVKWEEEQIAKGRDPQKAKYEEPAGPDVKALPELPEGWCWATVEQVVQCLDYKRIPINKEARIKRQGNIPYFGANGQVGWIDGYIFDEPLVLVVEDETFTGREIPFSYKITGKSWVNNHAHVLCPTPAVLVDYLNYSLAYYPFTPLTQGTTGRRKLTQRALMSAPYALPPLAEQEQIVSLVEERLSIVSTLESTIEQVLKRAERMRQSILHRAFTGRLVAQDPTDEPASVLLERIQRKREEAIGPQKVKSLVYKQQKERVGSSHRRVAEHVQSYLPLSVPEPEPVDTEATTQGGLWENDAL